MVERRAKWNYLLQTGLSLFYIEGIIKLTYSLVIKIFRIIFFNDFTDIYTTGHLP